MEPRRVYRCQHCGHVEADHVEDRSDCPAFVSDGRELGNAAAAASICVDPRTGKAIEGTSYQWYVRVGRPAGNRAPKHVWVDTEVTPPQRMYDLEAVRAWQRARKGRGNWGGIGARARKPPPEVDDPGGMSTAYAV
jgi:hypothetical protein